SSSPTLHTEEVTRVLAELVRLGEGEDPPAVERVLRRERDLGRRVWGEERAEAYGGAPLSIASEVGELLVVLVVARRPRTVVEFGASHGYSTIHLAAAARDVGACRVITTEIEPSKVAAARRNIAAAGLDDLVEIRVGDALTTLRDIRDVDLLFLDGWDNLYEPVVDLLQPQLTPGSSCPPGSGPATSASGSREGPRGRCTSGSSRALAWPSRCP
ncbi:MAG TPA: class I SAM-dependent methyltransferase, partial [Solirubrobacteraceae bacterium]|nr:class I SAM-dependent methyltransferase [Solirubrobacteraceae bacterium]